jgi:RecG-like helicase
VAPGRLPLSAGLDELDRARLLTRFAQRPAESTAIADAVERAHVRVVGEVTASRVVPRARVPWLQVTISDGSGSINAVFTGRRAISGLEPGRGVMVEGITRREGDVMVVMNPAYTLLA